MPEEVISEHQKALKELEKELGVATWSELAHHLAKDNLIIVSSSLKLLDVGFSVIKDDKDEIKTLIEKEKIKKPTENQILSWQTENPKFICLVARPFILVQLMA